MITFGGIPLEYTTYELSESVILPISYEATTTFLKGTRNGPRAILEASQALELYDEELGFEPFRVGIHTMEEVILPEEKHVSPIETIEERAVGPFRDGKFLIGLGGEHTVSIGLVRACSKIYTPLTVIQLDAHADLRDSYRDNPYNHACTLRRISEFCPTVHIGVRALDLEEVRFVRERGLRVIFAHQMRSENSWHRLALHGIKGPVYITIDLDVMDPSILPAVGTPEPGGLGWYDMIDFLRLLVTSFQVVGVDVVELCPRPGLEASNFIAAKLIYKLIGYRFYRRCPVSGHTS